MINYYGICSPNQLKNFPLAPHAPNLAIRIEWSYLEPQEGTFVWDAIDAALAALPAGGMASLTIHAGAVTPQWLMHMIPTATNAATGVSYPPPWNPTFQTRMQVMISRVAARYKDETRIQRVAIPALCANSTETNLGNARLTLAQWQSIGYTPTAAINAFKSNVNDLKNNFSQHIAVTRLPGKAGLNFDAVNGCDAMTTIATWFDSLANVIVMNCGANPNWVMSPISGMHMIYQEAAPVGNLTLFNQMINLINQAGVDTLEIYRTDLIYT